MIHKSPAYVIRLHGPCFRHVISEVVDGRAHENSPTNSHHVCCSLSHCLLMSFVMLGRTTCGPLMWQMGQATSPSKSAPCQQYLELQAFKVLEEKTQAFEKAQFKDDVENTNKEIKELKKPMLCLVASLNSSKAEVSRGIQQLHKDIQAKASKAKDRSKYGVK